MARMGGGVGTVVQRSYVSSTVMDKNGKKHQEKYFSNNVAHRGNDGKTVKFLKTVKKAKINEILKKRSLKDRRGIETPRKASTESAKRGC